MNDVFDDYDGQWYPVMFGGLSFLDICLTVEEKPQTRKLTRLGMNPGTIGETQRCFPLTTAVVS